MTITNGVDADRLRAFIGRIERLEEEKAALAADIRDVYAELKGAGYCPKTTRQVIKLRKIEADDRREQEELLDLYKHALGMLADLPLGEAAIEREASPVRKSVRKVQAAKPAPRHDPETGEITEPAEVRALDGIANAETSAIEAGHQPAGAPLHSITEPAPQPNARAVAEAHASALGITGARPRPYRVTDPAPEPVAPDQDVSPLIADAAALQAAARKLLAGMGAASE
jgi:uncharacterized protein (UPF0335 family)